MQFIVIGYDGADEQALERRMAAREAHLEAAKKWYDAGNFLYAAAFLSEEGRMIGSMIVCEFPSRKDVDEQWLKNEPYVTGDVWKKVEVYAAQAAPFCYNA